jgi:hypothetical protein
MSRLRVHCSAALVSGLVMAATCFAPATARDYTVRGSLDCGAGWDLCAQACNFRVAGGPPLGKCNDYCSRSAGVCEASRIPLPIGYRSHSRFAK